VVSIYDWESDVEHTAIYPGMGTIGGLTYCILGLNGEAGESAEKLKKAIRDNGGVISHDIRSAILLEIGDALWYLTRVAAELDSSLEEVMNLNVKKRRKRALEGKLSGSGDAR